MNRAASLIPLLCVATLATAMVHTAEADRGHPPATTASVSAPPPGFDSDPQTTPEPVPNIRPGEISTGSNNVFTEYNTPNLPLFTVVPEHPGPGRPFDIIYKISNFPIVTSYEVHGPGFDGHYTRRCDPRTARSDKTTTGRHRFRISRPGDYHVWIQLGALDKNCQGPTGINTEGLTVHVGNGAQASGR